jgi:hypothetical protein
MSLGRIGRTRCCAPALVAGMILPIAITHQFFRVGPILALKGFEHRGHGENFCENVQ